MHIYPLVLKSLSIQTSRPHHHSSRLVVFIGSSGSGKDTLMVKSRDQLLAEDLECHIAQRWITRKNDKTEQFKSITKEEFHTAVKNKIFSLSWEIYNNCYGVPSSEIDPFLEKGIVLVNLSRNELEKVRTLYPNCKVVFVDVSQELATERITQRRRDQGKMLEARLNRLKENIPLPVIPDLVVKNNSFTINSILIVLIEFIKSCRF